MKLYFWLNRKVVGMGKRGKDNKRGWVSWLKYLKVNFESSTYMLKR